MLQYWEVKQSISKTTIIKQDNWIDCQKKYKVCNEKKKKTLDTMYQALTTVKTETLNKIRKTNNNRKHSKLGKLRQFSYYVIIVSYYIILILWLHVNKINIDKIKEPLNLSIVKTTVCTVSRSQICKTTSSFPSSPFSPEVETPRHNRLGRRLLNSGNDVL